MRRKGRKSRAKRRVLLSVVLVAGLAVLAVVAFAVVEGRTRDASRANLDELTTRATSGDAEAQFRLGVLYADGSTNVAADPSSAFRWLQKAAVQGVPEAEEAVGEMLRSGNGTPADPAAAIDWYQKAASQGRATAQGRLGSLYRDGISVPQDFARALEWYRKAVRQDNGESMYNLAIMYAEGEGVEVDYLVAGQWFRKAAEHGYGFGVPKQYQDGVEWARQVQEYRPAAEKGDAEAQYQLATLLYGSETRARNVPLDRETAIALYHLAADQGHALAMYALGTIYQGKISRETLSDTDYVKAHMWYNLAASRLPPGWAREQAVKDREFLARYRLTPEQLAEAQRLAREWKPSQKN